MELVIGRKGKEFSISIMSLLQEKENPVLQFILRDTTIPHEHLLSENLTSIK
jgi:hypothetical protein